jgi:hypothetical protein
MQREGRAIALLRGLVTAALSQRIRSHGSPRGICGGHSGIETGPSPSLLVFPSHYRSTGSAYSLMNTTIGGGGGYNGLVGGHSFTNTVRGITNSRTYPST